MRGKIEIKFGLTERDLKTLADAFATFPDIEVVHIFGSRAMGNFKPGSDIDLAIMNTGVADKTVTALSARFSDSALPYHIDLINFPALTNTDFIAHIERVGKPLYKKEKTG